MDLSGMQLAPQGAAKQSLDAIPGLTPDLRAFLEQHDGGRGKVGTPDQDIDIASIADGVLVDPADPLGDGVATGDCVRYASGVECAPERAEDAVP